MRTQARPDSCNRYNSVHYVLIELCKNTATLRFFPRNRVIPLRRQYDTTVMIIKRTFFRLLAIIILGAFFNACENPTTGEQAQFISEVSWKTDGSGMLSFVQRFNTSLYTSFPPEEYELY